MVANVLWFSASSHVDLLAAAQAAGTGETFKNVTAGAASTATAVAVIIGGVWAYFKFIRGRTFKPKLSIALAGQWRSVPQVGNAFHARLRVTNIGASKADLKQFGTGLQVSFPSEDQPPPPRRFRWQPVPLAEDEKTPQVFSVLKEHRWIEPGETVSDDLLLNLGGSPRVAMLEVWLRWELPRRVRWWHKNVDVFARKIIPPDATMIDTG